MLILVFSSALGREVVDELDRIRRGQRPPDDEVRRQWANVLVQSRERWQTAHSGRERRRSARPPRG